jgi:outer membrane biosynthesis protein TonB
MYFNFEDYRPDTPTLPRSLTRLEVCLLTIVVYLSLVILMLVWPKLPFVQQWELQRQVELARQQELELQRQRDQARFVFIAPKVDLQAPKPPPRADLSDLDRKAQTVERAEKPTNTMPFSRGNTFERMEGAPPTPQQKPADAAQAQQQAANDQRQGMTLPEAPNAQEPRAVDVPQPPRGPSAGVLADAIRNVQKYAPRDSYVNLQGGADQNFAPSIQFDSKGVEFGPWLRRFIAQIRRNWIIPQAAMMLRGHVSITFFVDKATGRISELRVIRPSDVDAFNNSSYGALAASNPTYPLPPEYPDDRAFFTVTFYYNENPDR